MSKKRVLIVDDEPIVLKGLSQKIPWDEIGMELVGTASNGKQALSAIKRTEVDIVITDVMMPELDGLELIAQTMQLESRPRFIILSGHGEFDFAQRAMSFGVRHYALKPTRITDITRALAEISAEIDDVAAREDASSESASSDLLRDGLVRRAFAGDIQPDDMRHWTKLGVDPDTVTFVVIVVDLGVPTSPHLTRMVNLVAERIVRGGRVLGATETGTCVALLFLPENHIEGHVDGQMDDHDRVPPGLLALPAELRKLVTPKRTVAHTPAAPIDDLPRRYKDALETTVGNFYLAPEDVIVVESRTQPPLRDEWPSMATDLTDLTTEILEGSEQNVVRRIDSIVRVAAAELVDPRIVKKAILTTLKSAAKTIGITNDAPTNQRMEHIEATTDVEQLRAAVLPIVTVLAQTARDMNLSPHARTVAAIKTAVETRYAERGLSLKRIATTEVFANADYLGRVFRTTTGIGFNEYLLQVRMTEAARILRTFPRMSIRDLAERVGFGDNPQYFSSSFRNFHGVTPSEYRDNPER